MRTLFLFVVLGLMGWHVDSQLAVDRTTYRAILDSICEETSIPDPCAGQDIVLELSFTPDQVSVIKKSLSTCGEVHIYDQYICRWEVSPSHEVVIHCKNGQIHERLFKDFKVYLSGKLLYGFFAFEGHESGKIFFSKVSQSMSDISCFMSRFANEQLMNVC